MSESLFEQNGGTYRAAGDYFIPNVDAPDEAEYQIGVWGRQRLDYLKVHRRVFLVNLLTSGRLNEHLREIDVASRMRSETIIRQMMEAQGVTERLKAENQMLWVGKVNNIRFCADEIVRAELIYD